MSEHCYPCGGIGMTHDLAVHLYFRKGLRSGSDSKNYDYSKCV